MGAPIPLGTIGSGIYNAFSKNGVEKIGYKLPGKIGSLILGPYVGLIRPQNINPNKK